MKKEVRNSFKIYKEIVFIIFGGKCKNCGSKTKLRIHHKDSNWKNNNRKNLSLLCRVCHSRLHGYKMSKNNKEHVEKRECNGCNKEFVGEKNYVIYKFRNHVFNCKKSKLNVEDIH